MMKYENATIEDIKQLLPLCRRFQLESWQNFADFDYDLMDDWLAERIADHQSYVGIARNNGFMEQKDAVSRDIAGCLIGMAFTFPYSTTLVAGDYLWYVHPKFRGGMTGVRLLKNFEIWAKDKGAVRLIGGATSGIASKRTADLMQHIGFKAFGALAEKELR